MKKFPVRSWSTGKTYKVKVKDLEYSFSYAPWCAWEFTLYEPKKRRGFLYFRKVASRNIEKYGDSAFDGGFVREAERLVREYEDDVRREEARKYREEFGCREFEEWDGIISDLND